MMMSVGRVLLFIFFLFMTWSTSNDLSFATELASNSNCTVPPEAPSDIQHPHCINTNFDQFDVSWEKVDDATSYTLKRSTSIGDPNAEIIYSGPNTTYREFVNNGSGIGIPPGSYYYSVRSNNSCGSSLFFGKLSISVGEIEPPEMPESLHYPLSTEWNIFQIYWPQAQGASSYLLQRATNEYFSDAQTVYFDDGLAYWEPVNQTGEEEGISSGTYYYRLRSMASCGGSSWQNGHSIVVGCLLPTRPHNFDYPTYDGNGYFFITWANISGATGYALQRATDSSFSDAVTVYTGDSNQFRESEKLPGQEYGVSPGVYYYRVRANKK